MCAIQCGLAQVAASSAPRAHALAGPWVTLARSSKACTFHPSPLIARASSPAWLEPIPLDNAADSGRSLLRRMMSPHLFLALLPSNLYSDQGVLLSSPVGVPRMLDFYAVSATQVMSSRWRYL